jgi:hypothetical protein
MGQYHMVISSPRELSLDVKYYVDPGDCLQLIPTSNPTGAPLCLGGDELHAHSTKGSKYVRVVESLLCKGGKWYKAPVVWAGDNSGCHGYAVRNLEGSVEPTNLYNQCKLTNNGVRMDVSEIKPEECHFRFILNHDSNEYIEVEKFNGSYHC